MRKLRRAYQRNARKRKKFKQRAVAAGTAAAITLGITVSANKALAHTPDPHELLVAEDVDADLLANVEEVTICSCPFDPDQNHNEIPDGVELAKLCAADINELPWQGEALPGETYKWLAGQWGLETCDICGAKVTMGPGGIVNPRLGISVACNLIAIHYMEHGSFSYSGDVSSAGRIDVPALLRALELKLPFESDCHQLPVEPDADSDLISDNEEYTIGYRPFNGDQNHNEISDGVELAKHCAEIVNQLPWEHEVTEPNQTYRWVVPVYGVEACDICGQMIYMGDGGIVNPRLGLSVDCHPISIHYMEHGSFSYAGEVHNGRMDVPKLLQVLEVNYLPCEPNDHQLPVEPDADSDLISDNEEYAIGYQPFNPDQNRNEIPDGVELAKRSAVVIDQLPWREQALPGETYKWCEFQHGLEICDICGEKVNMGPAGVVNPKLGLSVDCPLIAIHYMEHGSFSHSGHYGGEPLHVGRIDVPALLRALELRYPCEPDEHQLPIDGNDLDGDLLTDSEELASGFNLHNPDQDSDLTPDGIELAKQCKVAIDQLPEFEFNAPPGIQEPHKIKYLLDGVGTCEICGFPAYMDYWEIVNPRLGLTINVTVLDAHYIEHGSFSCQGGGRIDVPLLLKILEMPHQCGDLGTIYLPGDLNKNCKEDFADFADFANKWLESTDPNED